MALREYKTREELQCLLDGEILGDNRERPDHNFLENSIRSVIAGVFTASELKVYGYPAAEPQYFFINEYSDIQYPYIEVRNPLTGHNTALLEAAVPLVIKEARQSISNHGRCIVVGDPTVCEAFIRELSSIMGEKYDPLETPDCGVFYMTPAQRTALLEEKCDAIPGISIDPVDVDRDGDNIHRLWKFGINAEHTKTCLRYLPSVCARTAEGELIGWAMSARIGYICNIYMLPEYRNRGAGRAMEIAVAKEFARRGMRVFKYIELTNTSVYDSSIRSPLWTLWTEEDKDTKAVNTQPCSAQYFKRVETP